MQSVDDTKAVYIAWKLGAPMQVKHPKNSRYANKNVWEDHDEYDDNSTFYIQVKLGLKSSSDPNDMSWINKIQYRIKPKEE